MGDNSDVPMDDSGIVIHAGIDENTVLTKALLQAVATAKDSRTSELDPLYESVYPEALSELLSHANQRGGIVAVEFAYEGFSITITENGRIRIRDGSPQIAQPGVGYG